MWKMWSGTTTPDKVFNFFCLFLIVAKRQLNRILIFHHTSFCCLYYVVCWENPLVFNGIYIKETLFFIIIIAIEGLHIKMNTNTR